MPYDPVRGWYKVDAGGNVITQQGGKEFVPGRDPESPMDAREILRRELDKRGLGALANDVWAMRTAGAQDSEINAWITETPVYKQRFAGLEQRKANGFSDMSEDEYINYENQAAQFMRAAGLPPGFYDDPTDFASFIGQNISLNELNQRVVNGYQQAANADPVVKEQLRTLYGVSDGDLAAFFLDPNRALPAIERASQVSRLAAEAQRTGFGQLSLSEADRLAALGVTPDQARSGFGSLAASKELFSTLPGESGTNISTGEQLSAAFENNAEAQQRLSRRQRARQARFQGDSSFATTQQGAALGSA